MKRLFVFLTVLCLVSCTTTLELEQGVYEPKVVVDGYIESGNYASIFLTWSSPFLTNYDSASIRGTFINNATITLTCSNGDSEVLTLFRRDEFFPPFVYKSVRVKGLVGYTYEIAVRIKGKIITASTTIPTAPELDTLCMEAMTDSSGLLSVTVHPSATKDVYLFAQLKSMLEGENYHPAKIPVFRIPPLDEIQKIYLYRTRATNLYLIDDTEEYYHGWESYQYAFIDTVFVKIGAIDSVSYQVLKSLYVDQSMQTNPFAFNTAGILTNIKGGIGRWTGIGMAPYQVYLKK